MERLRSRISGVAFDLSRGQVESAMSGELPDPLNEHFVVVSGRRYPPKQVLAAVTGLDRADFTTHQARSILRRLGFLTGRVRHLAKGGDLPGHEPSSAAEHLRPHRGRWVAIAGSEVLVAGDSPGQVLAWLETHNRVADSLFRVPVDPSLDQTAALG